MFSAEFFTNYSAKIHNIRLITSLASICFLNDVGISIQACCSALSTKDQHKQSQIIRQQLDSTIDSNVDWAGSVMDKLLDYQK